ncbi:MAG: hypothetical protein ACJAX5_002359, partial [Patiriisocius sp.]
DGGLVFFNRRLTFPLVDEMPPLMPNDVAL